MKSVYGAINLFIKDLIHSRVPRVISYEQKNLRSALSLQYLIHYQQRSNVFLHQIIAGNESWYYH